MQERDPSRPDEEELITPLDAIRLDKTALSVVSLKEADALDRAYWATQSPGARLEALEFMRQVMYGYDPIADRMKRVIEVVTRVPR
ncbi:MAG: hypothetical protein ACLQGP_26015 [Isosphaeraceae bacterium]